MPELPEVEGFRVTAERHLVGRRIERARALDPWMLKDGTPRVFARRLRGRLVVRADRRGKLLLLFTDGGHDGPVLGLHFGMTGHPVVTGDGEPVHRWDRVLLDLDSGETFRYRNARRLGAVRLLTRTEAADLSWSFGPDALDAPRQWFVEALRVRRGAIKGLLLNQSFLAGVGNIYADEALSEAGIAPGRAAHTLGDQEAARLHTCLRRILRRAVRAHRAGRDARFPLMDVRAQASRGLPAGCPRCGKPLRSARIAGRTTYWCRACQR